jgi:hypothetical protein
MEISRMVKWMGKEFSNLIMDQFMMDSIKIIESMGLANIGQEMEKYLKANGRMELGKDRDI